MPNPTPLPENDKIHSDFKPGLALPLPPRPNGNPLGAHTEAQNLLVRFNPRLVGFGIIGPSLDLCLGMSAPSQGCVVATPGDRNSEGQQ